ncbi:MAG TPA: helix-turn-helix transcriptional regulator [Terriglobales bacterium]|nr:helix-turn-helix transcriptional regulator [Terriglobales bacterium]
MMTQVAQSAKMQHGTFSRKKFIAALDEAEMEPKELAEEMDASVDAIARWMAGIASPKRMSAQFAADTLGVAVEDFYELPEIIYS